MKIFISHISEEKELAFILKRHIEKDFAEFVEVFVSSDSVSIEAGMPWLDAVEEALREATLEVILCSKSSTTQPWINFEAGGGWLANAQIVPICHTDMNPSNLPAPLSFLEALVASNEDSIKKLYSVIAAKANTTEPDIDLSNLIREIESFESGQRRIFQNQSKNKNVRSYATVSVILVTIASVIALWYADEMGIVNIISEGSEKSHLELRNKNEILEDSLDTFLSFNRIVLIDSPIYFNVYKAEKPYLKTNSDDIYPIIQDIDSLNNFVAFTERVAPDWNRDDQIARMDPNLIIMHYSAFKSELAGDIAATILFRRRLKDLISKTNAYFLIYTRKQVDIKDELGNEYEGSSVTFEEEELNLLDFINVTEPPQQMDNDCEVGREYIDLECHPDQAFEFKLKIKRLLSQ